MTPVDLAVAAVKKWLAERDRAERFERRYARSPKLPQRVVEARRRMREACIDAVIALKELPEGAVEFEGSRYRGIMSEDDWTIAVSSAKTAGPPLAVTELLNGGTP